MGLPMRYPRFFIVLFVALGLAAPPAGDAYAADTASRSDDLRQTEAMSGSAQLSSTAEGLARREAIVEALAMQVDLDIPEAGLIVNAVAVLAISVAEAGERLGVLKNPDVDAVIEVVSDIVGSTDPQADRASMDADSSTERVVPAAGPPGVADNPGMDVLLSKEMTPNAGPIERWRPLVERYFSPGRVEEALSIINCESNGDPNARNPRSSASGLFQFLDRTWSHSSEQAGFAGASPFSPEANVAAAAWLVGYSIDVGDSAWAHWTCRP